MIHESNEIGVPVDGNRDFKLAILEVNEDGSQFKVPLSKCEEQGPDGELVFYALFKKDETDFKIEGVNDGLRQVM